MANFNQNPFASTHSLDTNPFDDPTPTQPANDARLEQLRQREEDLQRREQELAAKAENIRKNGRNNWPPFMPLIFHSIPDEIPEASQLLVTRLYQLWLVLAATLIINVVACIMILISGSRDGGRDLGASIGYVFIITVTSFLLWYRYGDYIHFGTLPLTGPASPIYNGYMKATLFWNRTIRQLTVFKSRNRHSIIVNLYFFFGGFHLIFSVYMIIGVPSTGSAGLIQMIQIWVAAVFCLIATIGWTVQGLGNAFYYRQIYAHHTAAGHTMEKAKSELATHGAKAYFMRG
ncbi:unnamed protein product [Mycena citricolor]|uniref:Scamp-domain-containing protein n=1 Tax=Mycena citricolor TaxID=2018698 RepID=A0AAD2Q590_9AGAR|nr:unnamed protein product [Mycena citricolor]